MILHQIPLKVSEQNLVIMKIICTDPQIFQ